MSKRSIPGAPDKKLPGKLTFIDNSISSGTGTLSLRATFPNSAALLWPGLFVHVQLILTTLEGAVVVPSQCVMVGQQGPYVFVVGSDNTVALRPVQTGQRRTDYTVISSGVKAGEQVVTAGQLGLAQGKKVSPVPYQPPRNAHGTSPLPISKPGRKKMTCLTRLKSSRARRRCPARLASLKISEHAARAPDGGPPR